jgi:hypothetical protein
MNSLSHLLTLSTGPRDAMSREGGTQAVALSGLTSERPTGKRYHGTESGSANAAKPERCGVSP